MIDAFPKYAWVKPLKDKTAKSDLSGFLKQEMKLNDN